MRVAVQFAGDAVEFDVADDRVVGAWHGPEGRPAGEIAARVREALESPLDFPPLRRAVVPGDRVAIAWDAAIPDPASVWQPLCDVLLGAGVEREAIQLLLTGSPPPGWEAAVPPGVAATIHDPADASRIAYLASTGEGRRIYLNRLLTDADLVVPVGLLGPDAALGEHGPWGAIFPGASDAETLATHRSRSSRPGADAPAALAESLDVSWLLGTQFQVGIVPGASGIRDVLAGLTAAVRAEGARRIADEWTFRVPETADLVVAGIGPPGRPATLDELVEGLAAAARLVRRGGKIVALSRAEGTPGPALSRLIGADDPRAGLAALRGAEGEPDYPAAQRLAQTLARADVYLSSDLDDATVEDLGMIALGRPEEARRLAGLAGSCVFLSQAERTRVEPGEED